MKEFEYKHLLIAIEDNIATITINRPDISNALSLEAFFELRRAVEYLSADPNVKVIVLTGAGKNFSAGGHISEFKEMIDSGVFLTDELITAAGKMTSAVRRSPKPVIAMVNGSAAGAGCGLALAADFRIMTEKSKLVTAFINVAVPGDSGTLYYLSKMIGVSRATSYFMTGAPIEGKEAYSLGIAYVLAEPDKLEEETYSLVRRLRETPSEALSKQKALINEFLYSDLDRLTIRESEYMQHCSRHPDFTEAVSAFLEKRKPVFNKPL